MASPAESIVDIITIENFETKMPMWDPNAASHLYALVDMGSNGIRFSISDLPPPTARLLKCIYRERAAISLFDALSDNDTGTGQLTFPRETIRQVAKTLKRFQSIARDYDVPDSHISVFATEAMRRAANAADMLDAIKDSTPGLCVQILAPEVETLFGSVGARSSFVDVKGLMLDLGGGSVQMTYMDSSAARLLLAEPQPSGYEMAAAQTGQSMPFGAARLIRVLDGKDSKLKTATTSDLQSTMLAAFGRLCGQFPDLAAAARADKKDPRAAGVDVYLCGGGFRGYGSMLMHNDPIQPYPIPLIGAYTVAGDFFAETKKMRAVNKSCKDRIFGLSKRRREQFNAIATVVDALCQTVPNINSATFCAGGNREGALMMKLPRAVREANPLLLLPGLPGRSPDATQAVVDALQASLPSNMSEDELTFPLALLPLLAQRAWDGTGDDSAANAGAALHDAAARDPGGPGLNHAARASLALALWARWGGALAPADRPLRNNLQRVVGAEGPEGVFWAEYVGAAAAAVALVVPAFPGDGERVRNGIRFSATRVTFGNKEEIETKIHVGREAAMGLDLQQVKDCFKVVGKGRKEAKKVDVQVQEFSHE